MKTISREDNLVIRAALVGGGLSQEENGNSFVNRLAFHILI